MGRRELLAGMIFKAKQAYYFSGEEIMSDAEYDALEDELKSIDPDHPILATVGAPVPAGDHLAKVKHRMPMGSQNKVNTTSEFSEWLRLRGVGDERLHLSIKADGCSIAAYYEEGRLAQVVSRGDGETGEDVTANAVSFRGIPARLPGGENCAVRLEAVLTVDEWKKLDPERTSNPRSLANGILGRKDGKGATSVTAIAFDVEGVGATTEEDKSRWLESAGFHTTAWSVVDSSSDVESFWERARGARENGTANHWADGIVIKLNDLKSQSNLGIVSGRPKGQVAWKFPAEIARSTVLEIEWTVGHTGAVTPVAVIAPVRLGGTTVRRASLSNPGLIEALGLRDKSEIEVVKAGDIIPKITRVLTAKGNPITPPTCCPECAGPTTRLLNTDGKQSSVLYCRSGDCEAQTSGKIRRWAKSRDILGLGGAVIEALCSSGMVSEVEDLFKLRPQDIQELVINEEKSIRLGEKRAEAICREISDKSKSMKLSEFLGAFGTRSLGVRRAEIMISANPALADFEKWMDGSLLDSEFAKAAGVPNSGSVIYHGLKARENSLRQALSKVQIIEPASNTDGTQLPEICITGSLPSGRKKSDWREPLKEAGFTLVDSVKKGLYALVTADVEVETAKTRKAAKLGVRVVTEKMLEELVTERRKSREAPKKSGALHIGGPVTPKNDRRAVDATHLAGN